MNELPRLPMLFFDLKQSRCSVDFKTSFQKRILDIYSQDASGFISEIQEFENLRANAIRPTHDETGCSLLKRYYAQLSIVNNKFHYTSRSCDLVFEWIDNFTKLNVVGDIQLELDSILHNIGALNSELGAGGQRNDSDSIKWACTHFQCAAWVFKKLKENTHFKSKDLSQDLMAFNHFIMLAQAQECFLEKSILDKRNPSLIAKIGAEVVSQYDNLIAILIQSEIQEKDYLFNKLFKEWKKFFEFKISFYSAICSYSMGVCENENNKMGERVAWLIDADDKLKSSVKLAKANGQPTVIEAVDRLVELVKKTLDQTKKNNDFIYHDIVPSQDKLTAIKGVNLVGEIEFKISDENVMGKDIFHKLVPIEAYETVSIYSSTRDKMWRDIKSRIDDKNEELVKFLSIIQLDKDNIRQRKFHVPEKLASICASLNSSSTNFLEDVKERLDKMDKMCKEVNDQFKELEKKILDEEESEKKSSNKLNYKSSISDLKSEFERNYEVHKSAMQSNQSLREVVKTHEEDIELLMKSSVQDLEELFSMKAEDLPTDKDGSLSNKDNLAELDKLFDKIEEMKKQRAFLENKLKQSIKNDDTLKNVIAHSEEEIKSVFEKETEKFNVDIKYLDMNMNAQEQILNALTKANANYAQTRKEFMRVEKLRSERIEGLYESYENVQGVLINLDKGIEFYANLNKVIGQLKSKIMQHIEKRKKESSLLESKADDSSTINTSSSNVLSASSTPKSLNSSTINASIASPSSISSNVSFNENKGPSKLKDYLPYYNATKPTIHPANIPLNQPSSNPNILNYTNVPNIPNVSNVSNVSNVVNVSNMPPNLPPQQQLPNQNNLPVAPNAIASRPALINPNYPSANFAATTPQISNPSYSNYYPVSQPVSTVYSNPINQMPSLGYNPNVNTSVNPYLNYPHQQPQQPNLFPKNSMTPNPINYSQQHPTSISTSLTSSVNVQPQPPLNYQQPYQNGSYLASQQQQYLPTTNYYQPPNSLPLQQPPLQQPPALHQIPQQPPQVQPNANQNLNYSMQNLNLNNNGMQYGNYQNYNYAQQTVQPQPHPPARVNQQSMDSLLNTDNDLSEEAQPVLKPISLVSNTDSSDKKNVDK